MVNKISKDEKKPDYLTLNDLKCGEFGLIIKLEGPNKNRLSELGLTKGTNVKMICCGCYGGPLKIECRSCCYAIRKDEAKNIKIIGPNQI